LERRDWLLRVDCTADRLLSRYWAADCDWPIVPYPSVAELSRYIDDMERPTDPRDKASSYWIRGPRTRRHFYFYPSDNRAGFALMLLIGILGLIALGFGMMRIVGSSKVQRDDGRVQLVIATPR